MYDRHGRQVGGSLDAPSSHVPPPTQQVDTPLSSPEALYALTYLVGDHQLVDKLVRRFQSWSALARAGHSDLAFTVGTWAAQLRIPPTCPPLPTLPDGVVALSRYSKEYPHRLDDLEDAPVLVYRLGDIPTRPMLAIGGTHFPSQFGVSATISAVEAAVSARIPIVAALDSGCGHLALQEAVERRGRVLAVLSGDLAHPASNSVLFRRILDNGGGIISEYGPGEMWSEARTFSSARLVAALGSGVVLSEFGSHPAGGANLVRSAIACGRYLIVPTPPADAEMPLSADGAAALARPRSFSERLYGVHPRMAARVRAGQAPADAVVSNPSEMAQAITLACSAPAAKRPGRTAG